MPYTITESYFHRFIISITKMAAVCMTSEHFLTTVNKYKLFEKAADSFSAKMKLDRAGVGIIDT